MAEKINNEQSDLQKRIFEKISKNDFDGFRQLIAQCKEGVNFVDENGMTPLQHACCKGNKEAVEILLAMGADINFSQHGANYTPLHFAALSGNTEVCLLLLKAGMDPHCLNSVSRTASQMAAFVGNYACVETINNYISREQLEYYTQPPKDQKEPTLPPSLLDAVNSFVIDVNLHPVRIVLNLQSLGLLKHLTSLRKAMETMCSREMKKTYDVNELMAFKFHYLGWIVSELIRCEEQCKAQRKDKAGDCDANKHDYVDLFIKRVLKENKQGQLDFIEFTVRDCVREFPFRECTIFHQIVSQLGAKEPPPALYVLRNAINGYRGFAEQITYCKSCGNEKPDKKCSKCKAVQYCDRECQRLHWFMHKKTCTRPISNATAGAEGETPVAREPIDTNELHEELAKMTAT